LIYGFWLPLWYLPTLLCPFGHYVVCPSLIYGFWLLGIFKLFLSHILHISKSIITHIIACSYFFVWTSTVKPAHVVTSIKQYHVLKGHPFLVLS
jgi:hypothetical protein